MKVSVEGKHVHITDKSGIEFYFNSQTTNASTPHAFLIVQLAEKIVEQEKLIAKQKELLNSMV